MLRSKKAAAIKYVSEKDNAPRVVSKGRGYIADKILEVAKKNNIAIVEDAGLTEVLEALEVNTEIPPELYKAVAEVLAFVYKMNNMSPEDIGIK